MYTVAQQYFKEPGRRLTTPPPDMDCWIVTPPARGMKNQAIALAEAIGMPYRDITVDPRRPWTWLPSGWWPAPLMALGEGRETFAPPWPRLLISCGRRSVPYSLYVRRRSAGRTFTVHIQNPQTALDGFDLVTTPRHDGLAGDNVVPTDGSLHRITSELLQSEAARFADSLAHLPRPLVAVLIGGPNRYYKFSREDALALGSALASFAATHGLGLAVTASRRSGEENIAILQEALRETAHVFWNFAGDNPYHGYLGLADAVVVTGDSVNMVSEATATGKPVYVYHLPGHGRRFDAFHRLMEERGRTRRFDGTWSQWPCEAADDTGAVAREVLARLKG